MANHVNLINGSRILDDDPPATIDGLPTEVPHPKRWQGIPYPQDQNDRVRPTGKWSYVPKCNPIMMVSTNPVIMIK